MSAILYRAYYSRTIRYAALLALMAHLSLLVFSPPFEFQAYSVEPPPPPPLIEVTFAVAPPSDEIPEPRMPDDIPEPIGPPEADDEEPPEPPAPDPPPEVPPGVAPRPPGDDGFGIGIEQRPIPIRLGKAVYPELAQEAGIEGRVLIAILVDADGKPIETKILRSEVTPAMAEAALRAAMESRFEPGQQRNQPVRCWVTIPFDFRIR